MSSSLFLGTSGWNYKHWSGGVFYPEGMKQSHWLSHYCQYFDTVEINNTFYHLPAKQVFEEWRRATSDHFTFAVKASRFVTHMKKLKEPERHVALFLKNACGLRDKLGVVLFQLPPFWKFNRDRIEQLFEFMSRQKIVPGLRSTLEVRHESWLCDACFEVLRKHNVSLVLADWPGLAVTGPLTADFVFVRRHGPENLYASNYPDSSLKRDAKRIGTWLEEGKDVYMYFNNDARGYAVKNALSLRGILGKMTHKKGA